MIRELQNCLWKNFAASIDMLHNAIAEWPEQQEITHKKFYYLSYHTIVFLDYYLTIPLTQFTPQLSFTLIDMDKIPEGAIDDVIPDRIYHKQELLDYLAACRQKCREAIAALTTQNMGQRWIPDLDKADLSLASMDSRPYSQLEIHFYNMRHVQHHAAQLNMLLRQQAGRVPDYVSQSADDLQPR